MRDSGLDGFVAPSLPMTHRVVVERQPGVTHRGEMLSGCHVHHAFTSASSAVNRTTSASHIDCFHGRGLSYAFARSSA